VAPEVIAGYFLLYAVNGFYQHSNVRLRYGWLNYVVGSAETHRWHHARDPRKAYCNFGNTTIVWDLLFRTWYLPKEGPVDEIGITDKSYPKGFWAQMVTPFARRGAAALPRRGAARRIADALVPLQLKLLLAMRGRRIARLAKDPRAAQHRVLTRILRENSQTSFGRQHRLDDVGGHAEFASRVPVSEFEALRPFVEAEIERGERSLTNESPLCYMRTSGSTGKPKDVPLTQSHLQALRRIQQTSVAFQYRVCPEAFSGSILAIVSSAVEGHFENGKSYGAASGVVAAGTPRIVMTKFVLPKAVLGISDSRLKYLVILRLATAQRDITYLGSANSTTPLMLMKLYAEHQSQLIEDVGRGGFFLDEKLTDDVRSAIQSRLGADPARAAELESLRARSETPRIAELWPDLRMVVTWTCGSAGVTVGALRRELSPRTCVFELGYVASEFRGTFTLGKRAGTGFPTLDTHFFEFVERAKWDMGEPEFLTLDLLRKGVDYYIIVTTPAGLYRYFINDLVRVTGFFHRTPLFKFLQKGKGVTNITGEKLYEAQVLTAVREAMSEFELNARFVMMLADEEARTYRLYVEPDGGTRPEAERLSQVVDAALARLNVEYAAKRESERLGAPSAAWLRPDTGDAYKRYCVAQGQREGQFKSAALAYRRGFGFDLDAHAERT
jgi:hypothetical protein